MNDKEEKIILVDENDKILGEEEKLAAHQKAHCHRAFSVFVFKETSEGLAVLMQKRHDDKYHCGGLWTNTCCGHPRPGEKVIQAATRRLKEEMGLDIKLNYADRFHYVAPFENGLTENEVDHVLWANYTNEKILPNINEVSEYRWQSVDDLLAAVKNEGYEYTPWLEEALLIAIKREENTCEY